MGSTCPANSILTQDAQKNKICVCKPGFKPVNGICACNGVVNNNTCLTSCPPNSHATTSGTCACNTGFTLKNGSCVCKGYVCGNTCYVSCPANSYLWKSSCYCKPGFTLSNGQCVCVGGCIFNKKCYTTAPLNTVANATTGKCDCLSNYIPFSNYCGCKTPSSYVFNNKCVAACPVNSTPTYNSTSKLTVCVCNNNAPIVNGQCQSLGSGPAPTGLLGGPNQNPIGYGTICLYDNQYQDAAGTCQWCDATCFSCDDSGPTHCTACVRYWYWLDGTCYQICPPGYTKNDTVGSCDASS